MKLHPAIKKAKILFHNAGMDTMYCGTLSLHVCCREYFERPCIVDLKLSSFDDVAKIDVCEFSAGHPMYEQAMTLHGTTFNF